MTKFNICSLAMVALLACPLLSNGQVKMGSWANTSQNNFYIDYVGGRVIINSPTNIAGPVTHTISNDGNAGAGDWGASIQSLTTPIQDMEIVKADPYDACGTLTNAAQINGKIALVQRGTCEFGSKAKNALAAGAKAVIIVNNIPGAPVGMGAGQDGGTVTIPVIMVSDLDGAAIAAEIAASNTPKLTMTVWSNGKNNDIGIVDRGLSLWHSYSIPLNQIKGSTAVPYKMFNGLVIGNFGNVTSGPIKVKSTLSWTPTGGSTSIVRSDSVMTVGNFTALDSIITPFIDNTYDLSVTTTGRFDVNYEVTPSFADQSPGDNKAKYSFYVDNRIYSKGRYDFANDRPYSSIGYRVGNPPTEFTWGPMFYVEKAGFALENVKFVASKENAQTDNKMSGQGTVQILIFQWTDADNDSIMDQTEFAVKGIGSKTFVDPDTSGQIHTVAFTNTSGNGAAVSEANSWYWIAADVPGGPFLGCDGMINYFVRSWGRSMASVPYYERYAPMFQDNYQNLPSAQGLPQHYPFEGFIIEDSVRFAQQRNGLVPAMPVQMSIFPVNVDNTPSVDVFTVNMYPNPTTDVLNVNVNFGKEAKAISYKVIDVVGSHIKTETRNNRTTDKYSITTSELASGTYYLIIDADGKSMIKQFSVIK